MEHWNKISKTIDISKFTGVPTFKLIVGTLEHWNTVLKVIIFKKWLYIRLYESLLRFN
ncbi:hypothetical protein ACSXBG_17070 (plasmid) [Clostridium perfringens]